MGDQRGLGGEVMSADEIKAMFAQQDAKLEALRDLLIKVVFGQEGVEEELTPRPFVFECEVGVQGGWGYLKPKLPLGFRGHRVKVTIERIEGGKRAEYSY